ncbi:MULTISPECIES: hypothetical protein [Flavobacterium]|nr:MULTISPECIES: hypothetical protein [Flavobacterium]
MEKLTRKERICHAAINIKKTVMKAIGYSVAKKQSTIDKKNNDNP